MDNLIIFDVGANDGSSTYHYTSNPNNIVYAFEPTPFLLEKLYKLAENKPNYIVINKAVSNIKDKAWFNIAGQADWGCSSLNQFNDNLDITWEGRTDFKITEKIEVDVICLADFIEENNIKKIDYFHCDIQGNDLEALMGLKEYIKIVKEGVIEMPTSHNTKLYKNQKYIVEDAISFLENNNFTITSIVPNDKFNNEVNIYFKNNLY